MRTWSVCIAAGLFGTLAPARGLAATYYAAPSGNGDGTSESTPASVSTAVNAAGPGDTVYLRGGTYTGWSASIHPVRSGEPGAWITFAAYPGELPIFEGSGVGGGTHEYIRFVGLVSRGASGGFGNGWTDGSCSTMSNGNLEYVNCIADGNDINGIAHYCASGVRIKQCIVAHNGAVDPSWSSGVNLFAVKGGPDSNIVEQTVSFENIDISSNHSDGSGFILDQNSEGATFINNIGFRNGGSCIRLTNSTNAQIINNTCVNNGQDPTAQYHDEIFFSDTSTTHQGALLRNNLCIPTSGQRGLTMGDGVTSQNDEFSGTTAMVVSATSALDFHLASGSAAIDAGASGAPSPGEDIGFDWRCIKQQTGQAVSWWQYAVDYDYIGSIGGVAACFNPGTRTGAPDIGAYEFGAVPSTGGTGGAGGADAGGTAAGGGGTGAAGSGGTVSTGGSGAVTTGASGGVSAGGTPTGGADTGNGGLVSTGGSGSVTTGGGAGAATGGLPANGGAPAAGGAAAGSGGTPPATGGAAAGSGGAPPATCSADLALCGQQCTRLVSDPQNCGACGAVCGAGQVCSTGICTSSCSPGLTQCGQGCADVRVDILNCGRCGTVCLMGQTCQEGQCTGTSTGGDPTVPVVSDDAGGEDEPGGCACSTASSDAPRLGGVAGLALALSALIRRRRQPSRRTGRRDRAAGTVEHSSARIATLASAHCVLADSWQ